MDDKRWRARLDSWSNSSPYDAPDAPDLRIDTGTISTADAAQQVIKLLEDRKLIDR